MDKSTKEEYFARLSKEVLDAIPGDCINKCDFVDKLYIDGMSYFGFYKVFEKQQKQILAIPLGEIQWAEDYVKFNPATFSSRPPVFVPFWADGKTSIRSSHSTYNIFSCSVFFDLSDCKKEIFYSKYPVAVENQVKQVQKRFVEKYNKLLQVQIEKDFKDGWLFHKMKDIMPSLYAYSDSVFQGTEYAFYPRNPAAKYKYWEEYPDVWSLKPYETTRVA